VLRENIVPILPRSTVFNHHGGGAEQEQNNADDITSNNTMKQQSNTYLDSNFARMPLSQLSSDEEDDRLVVVLSLSGRGTNLPSHGFFSKSNGAKIREADEDETDFSSSSSDLSLHGEKESKSIWIVICRFFVLRTIVVLISGFCFLLLLGNKRNKSHDYFYLDVRTWGNTIG
jgi:hypothetical protein